MDPPPPSLGTFRNRNVTLVFLNPRFYLGTLLPLKVLKPTVSRESFWNHSIKKWSDIASPFILNDNIICSISLFDVLVQKMVTKNHKKFRTPSPLPYLGLFPKFYNFFVLPEFGKNNESESKYFLSDLLPES